MKEGSPGNEDKTPRKVVSNRAERKSV